MSIFGKNRGSITLFLSIILIPCLLFCAIMVDVANVHLSKALVEGAGVLSTNAALANYDTVLEDVYGIFAMSQKAGEGKTGQEAYDAMYAELNAQLEEYFYNSLNVKGLLSDEDAEALQSQLMNSFREALKLGAGDNLAENFIDISTVDFKASYVANSSLANPDILRNQIVEFMKYRGPAQVGLSMLDALAACKSVNEQSEVAEKKLQVDKKAGDLASKCKEFYKALVAFDNKFKEYKVTEEEFKKVDVETCLLNINYQILHYMVFEVEDIDSYVFDLNEIATGTTSVSDNEDAESKINAILNGEYSAKLSELKALCGEVSEWYHTTDAEGSADTDGNHDNDTNMYKIHKAYTQYQAFLEYVKQLLAIRKGIEEEIESLRNDIRAAQAEIDRLDSDYVLVGWDQSKNPPLQILEKVDHSEEISNLEDDISDYQDEIGELEDTEDVLNNYIHEVQTEIADILQSAKERYTTVIDNAHDQIQYYAKIVNDCIEPMYDAAQEVQKKGGFFENGDDAAEKAITKGEAVKTALEELVNANQEFGSSINAYSGGGGTTDNPETKDEYSTMMKSTYEKTKSEFSKDDVNEVLDQLRANEKYFNNSVEPLGIIPFLEAYKFYGIQLVASNNSLRKAANGNDTELIHKVIEVIGPRVTEWAENHLQDITRSYCDDRAQENMTVLDTSVIGNETETIYGKAISEANHPVNNDTLKINVPQFYVYLMMTYGDNTSSDKTEEDTVKAELKAKNDEASKQASGEDGSMESIKYSSDVFTDVPSNNSAETQKYNNDFAKMGNGDSAAVDQFSSMQKNASNILSILSDGLENIRDNMLVSCYIMENFSSYMNTVTREDGTKKEAVTLTNVPINAENNKIFGCEIEYIIYGNQGNEESGWLFFKTKETGPETNIANAKRDIFAVRLMCNSIYALTASEIDMYTKPPAMAIQAASGGIFPYQLAQVVIKLALATAESALDLEALLKGEEVALIKSKSTWACSPNGFGAYLKDKASDMAREYTERAIKEITAALQDLVDNAIEYTVENINNLTKQIKDNLTAAIDSGLNECISVLTQITGDAIEKKFLEIYTNGAEYVQSEFEAEVEAVMEAYINSVENESVRQFLNDNVKNQLQTQMVEALGGQLQNAYNSLQGALDNSEALNNLNISVADYKKLVEDIAAAGKEYISRAQQEIAAWAEENAIAISEEVKGMIQTEGDELAASVPEAVANKVNESLDSIFPSKTTELVDVSEGTSESKSGLVSCSIEFSYDDYLQLFLLLRLCDSAKNDEIVTRVADVIQLNMSTGFQDDGGVEFAAENSSFRMANAYTYVNLSTQIQVQPLLLDRKLFENELGQRIQYFSYQYQEIAGY